MKKCLLGMVILLLLMTTASCGRQTHEGNPAMQIDYAADASGQARYNGDAQEFFQVAEGMESTVEVTIKQKSGTLQITISEESNPDNVVYDGHEFPGEFFTVTVSQPGRYRILVHAENFVGSYHFQYDLMQ